MPPVTRGAVPQHHRNDIVLTRVRQSIRSAVCGFIRHFGDPAIDEFLLGRIESMVMWLDASIRSASSVKNSTRLLIE
jgi:hypothetical protein